MYNKIKQLNEYIKLILTHSVRVSVSEREESFEVTMTATEMKDDLDQESEDQSKVRVSSPYEPSET